MTSKAEFQYLLQSCRLLSFLNIKRTLLCELRDRLVKPGRIVDAGIEKCDWSCPAEIFAQLQIVHNTMRDANVHRTYTEMKLVEAVEERQKTSHRDIRGTGQRIAEHNVVPKKMALEKVGKVSTAERGYVERRCMANCKAGEKWLNICKWFGGNGIVFVFINVGRRPCCFHRSGFNQRIYRDESACCLGGDRQLDEFPAIVHGTSVRLNVARQRNRKRFGK